MSESRYARKRITVADLGTLTIQPPVCDFCAQHAPEYLYAARWMSDGTPRIVWRWCACPDCAARIEAGAFAEVVEVTTEALARVMPGVPHLAVQMAATQALYEFHRDVCRAGVEP